MDDGRYMLVRTDCAGGQACQGRIQVHDFVPLACQFCLHAPSASIRSLFPFVSPKIGILGEEGKKEEEEREDTEENWQQPHRITHAPTMRARRG